MASKRWLAMVTLVLTATVGLGMNRLVSGATTTTTTPAADAFVASDLPTTNEGTLSQVSTDASPTRWGYFKFAVAVPAGDVVTAATFSCWAGSSNTAGTSVYSAPSSWTETGITWDTKPAPSGAALGTTGAVTGGAWTPPVSVAAAFGGSGTYAGTYTFVTETTSSTQWSCAARESAGNHPARLALTIATPATTTSVPPTTTASGHVNTTLPARGTFSYPWYPEAWTQGGLDPATHFHPSAGFYTSLNVLAAQQAAKVYAGMQFDVSSWWGKGSLEDARFAPSLAAAHGTGLQVAPYYEAEGNVVGGVAGSPNPASSQITADLDYIAANYVADPSYMYVAGRPVIFVYGDPTDGCATAARWAAANAAASTRFYVVLKVFAGYGGCANQPDNWHQYAPASAAVQQGAHSYSISPGYDKYNAATPLLARDTARWATNVQAMNCATADLKVVTTFNEWGEGTSVESATEWASASGHGTYLDELHNDTTCGSPPPTTTTSSVAGTTTTSSIPSTTIPSTTIPSTTIPSTTIPATTTSTGPAPPGVPVYDHIFYVMDENHDYSSIIGNANAPYLNSLARANALATNYHAITHPSVNNYLAAVSGQVYSTAPPAIGSPITDNCTVATTSCSTGAANIADRIEASGRSWKGYMESMPSPCYVPHDAGSYAERHNPFPYFNQIRNQPARCARIVPYTQLATDLASAATTPAFAWITPNLCDDMHDGCAPSNSVTNGDTWASVAFPKIFASAAWRTQRCLLVFNEDENSGSAGNQVPAIFVSSNGTVVAGHQSATNYTHYSLLRTIEASWGLAPVGPGDAAASPMVDMFHP